MRSRIPTAAGLRGPARHSHHRLTSLPTALIATTCLMVAAWAPVNEAHAADAAPVTSPLNSSGPHPHMTYYQDYYYLMTMPWKGR
ncbi:hypothetical protein AB0P41_30090 [Streptomyces sp. NPDC079167]|uniref:hypothetical protein n=1 Tax=Streptomyces sp. NPDC079167 TaxID=3154513 RepID=UPI00343FF2B7